MKVQFNRIGSSPILEPDMTLKWEAGGIFAPAVIHEKDSWKMLYRAYGTDKISRLGYAESTDGINWTKDPEPRVVPDNSLLESSGVEDPRIVKIADDYLISYTAYDEKKRYVKTRIRILSTTDFKTFRHITPAFANHWRRNDKDGVLFPEKINGRYYMLHRIEPNIQFSFSRNLKRWSDAAVMLAPSAQEWESCKIGAGAPPLKTSIGWLAFYHGVDHNKKYSMGVAVFDSHTPSKVLYRLPYPVLTPEKLYEKEGVVPNVVFGTSAIEVGDEYRLYYGAADESIAVATINKNELITELKKYPVENKIDETKESIDFLQHVCGGSGPKSSFASGDFLE